MPGLIKKVVKSEYTDLVEGQDGLTFGQHIDNQIRQAIEDREDVQEFNLIFEESEWKAMCRGIAVSKIPPRGPKLKI